MGDFFTNMINGISGSINDISGAINNGIHNATTGNGIASGNWDSLQTGTNRLVDLLPHAFGGAANDYISQVGAGIGNAGSSIFGSLSFQPSFYIAGALGILGLGIVLYLLMKV